MKNIQSIGIIGSGAWGTALAQTMASASKQVRIFSRNENVVADINAQHINSVYLPNIKLDARISASQDFSKAVTSDALMLVVPAQHMRAACSKLAQYSLQDITLIICAKGIENSTGRLMNDIVKEFFPHNTRAVLSGPSFASEVAQNLPTAVTIAADTLDIAKHLCEQLGNRSMRTYAASDIIGVEVAGAIKNVIAIACGISMGKNFGENARAALLTRGLNEMTRLAVACGGKAETMMGLAGLGDLVLTCGSVQSRNMSLGFALGEGKSLQVVMGERHSVAEGVTTSLAAQNLAKKLGVDCPIIDAVADVLHHGAQIDDAISQLLSRPLKVE